MGNVGDDYDISGLVEWQFIGYRMILHAMIHKITMLCVCIYIYVSIDRSIYLQTDTQTAGLTLYVSCTSKPFSSVESHVFLG